MKSTGIVRQIDNLGRIVIPKELRKVLNMPTGTPIEIYTTQNEKLALSMAILALEKEKEPALQEAKTSSNKNISIKNDNTKSKECQEVINVAARILTSYVGYLPEREQELWKMGGAHALLKKADKLFEGEKK